MAKDIPSFMKQLQNKKATIKDEDSDDQNDGAGGGGKLPPDGQGSANQADYGNWEGYSLIVRLGEQWGGRLSRYRSVKNA